MLAKSKLNSIETLISKALIDLEYSPEEFKTIANEKQKYEKIKEDIRMMKSSNRLNNKKRQKWEIKQHIYEWKWLKLKTYIFFNTYKNNNH